MLRLKRRTKKKGRRSALEIRRDRCVHAKRLETGY
jgi:hypothetical protein